jgi:hypothetical protein
VDREERQQRRLDVLNGEGLEVEVDALPLDFLMAVFRDTGQPMNRRVKCAEIAAKYCHAQLSAIAVHQAGDDFGLRLERAISASNAARQEPKLIEAQTKVTNGGNHSLSPEEVSEKAMKRNFSSFRRRA